MLLGTPGHYTTWLIGPSIVGGLLFINVVLEGSADSLLVPYFGLFMALWSTYVSPLVTVPLTAW